MAKHAHTGVGTWTPGGAVRSAIAWNDARPRAAVGSIRGWAWMALVAVTFFWMSNPLVFVPGFHLALPKAITWTTVVVIVTLPWLRVPRVPWPWIVFHGVALLSVLWTIDPHLTDYTNDLYLKVTVLALVVAANCEPLVVCWGLGVGGAIVTALSVYAYHQEMWGAAYTTGLESGEIVTVLAGVGTNENILAYTLCLSFAAMLAAGPPRRLAARAAWLVVFALNVYGLYLAQSGTGFLTVLSILLVSAIVVALPSLRRGRRHVLAWIVASATTMLFALVLVANALGKELSTLSNRSPFWRATIEVSLDRAPWLGSGWGAVWPHPWSMVPPNAVAEEIVTRAGYPLPHGHNFFIDVLPELGVLGVALAMLMVLYVALEVRRSGAYVGDRDPAAGRLALLVLVALLVSGTTEPLLTAPLGWWSLTLVAALPRRTTGHLPPASGQSLPEPDRQWSPDRPRRSRDRATARRRTA